MLQFVYNRGLLVHKYIMDILGVTEKLANCIIRPPRVVYSLKDLGTVELIHRRGSFRIFRQNILTT